MLNELGVTITDRGNVWRDARWMTSVPGVFTAGDMQHGQSLIVWAIGRGPFRRARRRRVPDGQVRSQRAHRIV
jgi:NADPH-dependent glutamate synthase beta subunit-like oxidoreductase